MPPTDLNFTAPLSIAENQPVGTVVGEFNATDPDAGATLTYSLLSGAGDGNNSLFTLDQNGTLKTATTFDFESNASSYSIRVQVKDEFNASIEGNFTVILNDLDDRPAIVSNGQLTKVSGTEAIVRPTVGQVGGGLITVAPHGPSKGVALTLFWGHADGGTNPHPGPIRFRLAIILGKHPNQASRPTDTWRYSPTRRNTSLR